MAVKLNLNLDKSLNKSVMTIYHSVHYKGNRFRISSGQAVEPQHWDKAKDKQLVKRSRANYDVINSILKKQKNDIERIIMNLELGCKPVSKISVVSQLPWINSVEVRSFKPLALFQKFIEERKASDKADRTIKGYNTALKYISKYESSLSTPISFPDFNDAFYTGFRKYLDMYDNAFGSNIKNIKTFLNWSTDKGYNQTLLFRKWKIPNEDGKNHFFLKHSEIQCLANTNFESRLEKVRDLFLISCYCGLRYSDLVSLKPIHVQDGLITKVACKTNEFVKIPVIPELQEILNKYWQNGKSLPTITNQKGNEYLKELSGIAKLDRPFNYIQKKGRKITETTYKAWEMMSWHIGRHSFITNCIQFGVPQDVVRRVVGHSSFKTLEKYIHNDDDFNKSEFMKMSNKYKSTKIETNQ